MPASSNLESIRLRAVADLSDYFNEFIKQQTIEDPKLQSAIEYALLNGGKRIRPLLVYLVGEMLSIRQKDLTAIALAIECIHAYSLVHDDLPAMDNDDLRRGLPTCHIKFDEATAILAGDALQNMAIEVICHATSYSDKQKTQLTLILTKAAGAQGMVAGQSLDLAATNMAISLDQLTKLHSLKTGALLRASVNMPCQLCKNLSTEDLNTILLFASHIGLAFQIQDDILDIISSTEALGKPQGSDENNNKSTFVSLLGLDGAKNKLASEHEQAVQALRKLPYNTENLISFTDFMVTRTY